MFTLPFLTNTREQVTALLHSNLAKKVCAEAEAANGTVIVNLCDAGGYRSSPTPSTPSRLLLTSAEEEEGPGRCAPTA